MATSIEAADLLTLQACGLKIAGKPVTKESAMAKYEASEVCVRVATEAVQILGGYGYTKDFPARSSTETASYAPSGRAPVKSKTGHQSRIAQG